MRRIIIGISGASGVAYGVRLLQVLATVDEVLPACARAERARLKPVGARP